jgi:hypothetical protein
VSWSQPLAVASVLLSWAMPLLSIIRFGLGLDTRPSINGKGEKCFITRAPNHFDEMTLRPQDILVTLRQGILKGEVSLYR